MKRARRSSTGAGRDVRIDTSRRSSTGAGRAVRIGVGGSRGLAGEAPCVLVEAAPMVAFAVRWMEGRFGSG
ncbi:MAG: hypothetical protein ABWZ57_14590 [Mesorhizobium sp.]